jgi:hypothetical protein
MTNAPAAHIAIRAGAQGPAYTYSVACASSAVAIAEAAKAIAAGDIDIAIAGGAEALLVPGVVRAWQALQTLATPDATDPSQSCRPFDTHRSGFALGEGDRLRAVVPEVAPGPLVQLAGNAPLLHEPADLLLRAVARARVDDHPVIDVGRDAFDEFVNDVRLVAHDHVQADGRPVAFTLRHAPIVLGRITDSKQA